MIPGPHPPCLFLGLSPIPNRNTWPVKPGTEGTIHRESPCLLAHEPWTMKIAYITAGAANMFCGSCLHDNTLAAALMRQGHEALLIPTYTPIRTDEPDVSMKRVFLGGINVYLQQKLALFRHTPWILDRVMDARG